MPSEAQGSPQPNIRTIARSLGVSSTTVSRALRNQAKVSAALRDRILGVAAEMGYHPDPRVSLLMSHLQQRHKPRFRSVIHALTTAHERMDTDYHRRVMTGADARAEALGYRLELQRLSPDARGLERVLSHRGVEGLLLLAQQAPCSLEGLLDWSRFAVVATSHSVLAPFCDRVVPDQFGNMLTICRTLHQRGRNRIGLIIEARHDLRVRHAFSAAALWHNARGGGEEVAPLIYHKLEREPLRAWFARERPDAVVAAGEECCRQIASWLGAGLAETVCFAAANLEPGAALAGVDERPEMVGGQAIERLHAKLLSGSRGIPECPVVSLIPGAWRDGA